LVGSLARFALVLVAVALAAGAGALLGERSRDEEPSASPPRAPSSPARPTAYHGQLGAIVGGLAVLREERLAELRRADDPQAQARVIDSLVTAYDATAGALTDMNPPESIRAEHAAAETAVADLVSAYRELGQAADRGDRDAYDRAREAVRSADAASGDRLAATLNAAGDQS
jgi:hypothetical protein